jgi:hypothetical protein
MTRLELEMKVNAAIDRLESRQPKEDDRIEFKGSWVDPKKKAAWLLGGHANSLHGDIAIWVIGVDEIQGVVGADAVEVSSWIAQLNSRFDEKVVPELLQHVNIQRGDKTVVALSFSTDRAPYFVWPYDKYGNEIGRDIPYRKGTSTDSATRAQLLSILYPLVTLPELELISLNAVVDYAGRRGQVIDGIDLDLRFYIYHKSPMPLVIPKTRINYTLCESTGKRIDIGVTRRTSSDYVNVNNDEYVIKGSGSVYFGLFGGLDKNTHLSHDMVFKVELSPYGYNRKIGLIANLVRTTATNDRHEWEVRNPEST